MSSGLALFVSITVTAAAVDGISLLMVQSVQPQQPLMVECTWHMVPAAEKRICTAYVTLKESVRKSTRVLCAWDSGSANVAVTNLLMLTQAGPECPGSTWKKYLPHRLNNSRFKFLVRAINKLPVDRIDTSTVSSTFDMDQLAKIRRHWTGMSAVKLIK